MGDRFTHGERLLVQIQRALEHDGQDVGGAAGLFAAGLHDLGEPVAVVILQLADPWLVRWFSEQAREAAVAVGRDLSNFQVMSAAPVSAAIFATACEWALPVAAAPSSTLQT